MAKQRDRHLDRQAFWEAYDKKCAYCHEIIEFLELVIDHVIPQKLLEDRAAFEAVRASHGLGDAFDIYSDTNRVAACARCNGQKLDQTYPPERTTIILGIATQKSAKVAELRAKHRGRIKRDKVLANLGTAIETGALSRTDIRDFVDETSTPRDLAPNGTSTSLAGVDSARQSTQDSDLIRIFGNVSSALLSWPQETEGQWIPRPESDRLYAALNENNHSFSVLLGDAGSGKSALLARLGNDLKNRGVALVALKADLIPKTVETLDDLEHWLGLPRPVVDCLQELAESRSVVLLIDQVDALTELMDQHTSRLTVLLTLINRIRGTENVHVLLSCREFEFRHDLRVSLMKPTPIHIIDPPWEAVRALLAEVGVDTTGWPNPVRQLLRRPQHLSLFVKHLAEATGTPTFHTYHSMMEAVLRERVYEQPGGDSVLAALEEFAGVAAEEEELWLPWVRFAKRSRDLQRLVAADILVYSPDGLRIGFRHQTLFDFVRARAFASGAIALAEHVLARQDALFVRPTLWSGLQYLREADRAAYHREFRILWNNLNLRRHVRYLLIAFLGQVSDPDPVETGWLTPLLDDLSLRAKALRAVEGSPAWFCRLKNRLPVLMSGDDEAAWYASRVIRRALNFDRDTALSLIEKYWLPDPQRDQLTLNTVSELQEWNDLATRVAEVLIARTAHLDHLFCHTVQAAATVRPDLAARLVATQLWTCLKRAEAEPVQVPEAPPDDAPDEERYTYQLVRMDEPYRAVAKIVSNSSLWYELSKVAEAAPRAFTEQVWPWVTHVARRHASHREQRCQAYRRDPVFHLSGDATGRLRELTFGLEAAIVAWAKGSPEEFLSFMHEQEGSDLLIAHRLLAQGLAVLAGRHPEQVAEYLIGDPRRLALGPYDDAHRESRTIISSVISHLDQPGKLRLERAVLSWDYHTPDESLEPVDRRERLLWNRQHRLRLLRSFPVEILSPQAQRYREQEERAFPRMPDTDISYSSPEFDRVGSPVSPEQMARASDTDLVNLFDELHDGTGWQHPRHFMKGGCIEASRAFGRFAETNQQRALNLLRQLQPGRHETYAAAAMQAMCEAKEHDVAALIESVHDLATRGFNSEEFRHNTAWGLAKISPESGGLDPDTCSLLESWLTDEIESSFTEETPAREANPSCILLGQKMRVLPRGNYPILHALFSGHLTRRPADIEGWLAVLERHIPRRENPQVWETLTHPDLTMLARAERHRAIDFVERLVEHHPAVVNTVGFVHFIGRTHDWLPESATHHCLAQWEMGSWESGPQAASEIAMLRYALAPNDEPCKILVERILKGDGIDPEKAKVMRMGVAFLAAELWSVQRARGICTRVLLDLLDLADESLANAWLSVFRDTELLVDQYTQQLLDALAGSPLVLRCGHSGFLVDRLKDLLQESTEAQRVCEIATALLDECGPEVGDFRTAWSASAGDLVDIALTLQRLEATRSCGLDLFERLMDFNAYKVAESLTELDRRFPN